MPFCIHYHIDMLVPTHVCIIASKYMQSQKLKYKDYQISFQTFFVRHFY